jgi:hypothetical protein
MAITSIKTGSSFTNLKKYDSFLAGNTAFNPSSYESIATINATGSTATFSSIPSTYKHLQLRTLFQDSWVNSGSSNLNIIFNGDTTGANYTFHRLYGNGTNTTAQGYTSTGYVQMYSCGASALDVNIFGVGIMDIIDYASTAKYKTVRAFSGVDGNTASTQWKVALTSGLWLSTSAITSLTITPGVTGFSSGTTFALYGIKS